MKVGLYLNNRNIEDVDLSRPEKGNPGVGGTQFNFVTLPFYFQKNLKDADVEFILYANNINKLPISINSRKVKNGVDALKKAAMDSCEMFIWRPLNGEKSFRFIEEAKKNKIKVIAWAHNIPDLEVLKKLSEEDIVKRFVCVGRQQLDRLRDHPVFYKSTLIYNGFDPQNYVPENFSVKSNNSVVYVGSLTYSKGFHVLARIWPEIIKRNKRAKLIVIGSGKLYDRNSQLGKWKIAGEQYEKKYIRPYLSKENGEIHESVEFKGLMGVEKIDILKKATVGVVNPTGQTENCPGSAIEFQAAKTPVVSGPYKGILDTVLHKKTGLLGKNDKQLIRYILYFLNNREVVREYGKRGLQFVRNRFNYGKVSENWFKLFREVKENEPNRIEKIKEYPFKDYKLIRELLRILKKYIPPFRSIPSIHEIISRMYEKKKS